MTLKRVKGIWIATVGNVYFYRTTHTEAIFAGLIYKCGL